MSPRAASSTTFGSITVTVIVLILITFVLEYRPSPGLPAWAPRSVGEQDALSVADGTSAVTAGADGQQLYVGLFPSHGRGGVAVVHVARRTVERVVPIASGVLGVAVRRDGTQVYATAADSNTLEVIDPASGVVQRSIPVGSYPQGVALSPDEQKAYVVDYGDDAVSVVDLAAGRVATKVSVGTGPGELAVSPDGSQVVVGNQNDDSISVIDTSSPTTSTTVTVGEGASHPAFSPDGSRLFVTLSNHGFGPFSVLELDPNTHETRGQTQLDRLVFALSAGTDRVYAATVTPRGGPAFLDTLDIGSSSSTPAREDALPGKPRSSALSPDGRLLWVVTGSNTITAQRVA